MNIEQNFKFRGKEIQAELPNGEFLTGQFVYGSLLVGNGLCNILEPIEGAFRNYKVFPQTVGLCTGLKNIYGYDVYQHDIVHVKVYLNNFYDSGLFTQEELRKMCLMDMRGRLWKEYDCEVIYKNGTFVLGDIYISAFFDMQVKPIIYEIDVIGNRFDNPGLLTNIVK